MYDILNFATGQQARSGLEDGEIADTPRSEVVPAPQTNAVTAGCPIEAQRAREAKVLGIDRAGKYRPSHNPKFDQDLAYTVNGTWRIMQFNRKSGQYILQHPEGYILHADPRLINVVPTVLKQDSVQVENSIIDDIDALMDIDPQIPEDTGEDLAIELLQEDAPPQMSAAEEFNQLITSVLMGTPEDGRQKRASPLQPDSTPRKLVRVAPSCSKNLRLQPSPSPRHYKLKTFSNQLITGVECRIRHIDLFITNELTLDVPSNRIAI